MKNNPLYKMDWKPIIQKMAYALAIFISIILTPFTIIFWLFSNNNFKEDWYGIGEMIVEIILYLIIPYDITS